MYQALQRGTGQHDMSCGNGTGRGGKKYIKNRTAGTGRRDNNISSIAYLVQAEGTITYQASHTWYRPRGQQYIKHHTPGTGRRDNNISSIAHLVQAEEPTTYQASHTWYRLKGQQYIKHRTAGTG